MPFVIRKLDPVTAGSRTIYRPGTFFAGWCDPNSGLYTTVTDRPCAFVFSYRPDAEACANKLAVVSEGQYAALRESRLAITSMMIANLVNR